MLSRATQSLWWPGLRADLNLTREACGSCTFRAPSKLGPPPMAPMQPDFPFSHMVADFFQVNTIYLANADRYSNCLSVFRLRKDYSAHVIEALYLFFSRWGVAKNLITDGKSVFTLLAMKDFYDRWGMGHRVSSPTTRGTIKGRIWASSPPSAFS